MCPDWESNLRPFGSQVGAQSTEPHQPGQKKIIFILNLRIGKRKEQIFFSIFVEVVQFGVLALAYQGCREYPMVTQAAAKRGQGLHSKLDCLYVTPNKSGQLACGKL